MEKEHNEVTHYTFILKYGDLKDKSLDSFISFLDINDMVKHLCTILHNAFQDMYLEADSNVRKNIVIRYDYVYSNVCKLVKELFYLDSNIIFRDGNSSNSDFIVKDFIINPQDDQTRFVKHMKLFNVELSRLLKKQDMKIYIKLYMDKKTYTDDSIPSDFNPNGITCEDNGAVGSYDTPDFSKKKVFGIFLEKYDNPKSNPAYFDGVRDRNLDCTINPCNKTLGYLRCPKNDPIKDFYVVNIKYNQFGSAIDSNTNEPYDIAICTKLTTSFKTFNPKTCFKSDHMYTDGIPFYLISSSAEGNKSLVNNDPHSLHFIINSILYKIRDNIDYDPNIKDAESKLRQNKLEAVFKAISAHIDQYALDIETLICDHPEYWNGDKYLLKELLNTDDLMYKLNCHLLDLSKKLTHIINNHILKVGTMHIEISLDMKDHHKYTKDNREEFLFIDDNSSTYYKLLKV